jgi:hypothetical protein
MRYAERDTLHPDSSITQNEKEFTLLNEKKILLGIRLSVEDPYLFGRLPIPSGMRDNA